MNGPFTCSTCWVDFVTISDRSTHVCSGDKTDGGPYTCVTCLLKFPSIDKWQVHECKGEPDIDKGEDSPTTENLKTFPSGAVRTNIDEHRYDLVSPYGLERLAKRYAIGAVKRGDRNWEKGMPSEEILNHMERHLVLFKQGDRETDHMAALAWGAFAIMHFEELEKKEAVGD